MKFTPEYLWYALILGAIAVYFANKQGYKRPFLYFFAGFLFGLLGIAFLFFGTSFKKAKTPAETATQPVRILEILESRFGNKLWYYLDEKMEQKGPVSSSLLEEKLLTGQISTDTYVWNEALDDWKSLNTFLTS